MRTNAARLSRGGLVALVFGLLLNFVPFEVKAGGEEVVVIYTTQLPESKSVADYYASKRGVPANQIIGLDVPSGDTISRADYVRQIQDPLLKELAKRDLVRFHAEIRPSRSDRPGRIVYQATAAKVRYLALCFGLPFRVAHDPNYDPKRDDDAPDGLAPQLRRDEASVDSELMLLPIAGRTPTFGAVRNPLLGATNKALLHPTNGVFLVSRLDGPSVEIAKGLVDKALIAERDGLNGRAYFDLRNITEGAYATGDQWITNAASVATRLGFETTVDNNPNTLGVGFPFAHAAIYAGWYSSQADGPFTLPVVEFMPGAIAYHLHSFSGQFIRDPAHNWVGPLLAKGATVTLGCVDEPYLDLTPRIDVFLERLALNDFTVGEAGVVCQAYLSWQNVVLGDPLYRPFAKQTLALEEFHRAAGNPLLAWPLIRKVNVHTLNGRDPDILRQYLIEQPLATNSAVLSEKVARLFNDRKKNRQAIEWAQRSLKLPDGSPQQHARLWRELAEWQLPLDPQGAIASLEAFAHEFPHHPEMLAVRVRELDFASPLKHSNDIKRIQAEITRLTPTTNPPASTKP
jgi:uncharacterized protein (TIGR03790 family)